jgi:hypothetical protein
LILLNNFKNKPIKITFVFLEVAMGNDKRDEEQEKGFVVRDKRFSSKQEEMGEPRAKEGEKMGETPREDISVQEGPLPEIDFTSFIFSLSTSVLIQLGEIQDPFTQKSVKNLPLAKQTIDLIGMLKEKTKGNLTPEEERIIEYILYDLKMKYVKAAGVT